MNWRPTFAVLRWLPAAIIVLAVVLLFGTGLGVDLAWSLASKRLPDGVNIESVQGRFIGPFTVTGADVSTDAADVAFDRLVLDWRPSRLLLARVHIAELAVDGLDVRLKPSDQPPPPEPEKPTPTLDLRAPITLIVENLRVIDAEFQPAPDAPVERLDRLELRAAWDRGALEIARLAIDAPRTGTVRAHALALLEPNAVTLQTLDVQLPDLDGSLTASGLIRQTPSTYRVALDAQYTNLRWPLTGDPMVRSPSGQITASGRLPDLVGEATIALISRDQTARINVVGKQAGDAVDARVTWSDLAWPLESTAGPVQVRAPSGDVTVRGPMTAMAINGQARVQPAATPALDLDIQGQASSEQLRLSPLTVRTAGSRTQLTGNLRWTPDLAGEFVLTSRDLDPSAMTAALADWPGLLSADARVTLTSNTGGVVVDVQDLSVDGELRDQPLRLQAVARVTPEQATVSTLQLDALGGRIDGSADVGFGDTLTGAAQLRFAGINPGVVARDWPGDLAGNVRVGLAGTPAAPVINLPELTMDGVLRQRPLSVAAVLRYAEAAATIETLNLSSGDSRFTAQGRAAADRLDLRFDLDSPTLADFYPGLRGRLTASGQVAGPAARPHVSAQADGTNVGYAGTTLGELRLVADTNLATGAPFAVDLTVTGGDLGGIGLRSFALALTGPADDHRLTLDADTTEGRLQLAANGSLDLDQPGWDGAVTELVAAPADLEAWVLDAPFSASVDAGDWQLDPACLRTAAAGGVCLRGKGVGETLDIAADIQRFNLDYITPMLPPATELTGRVQGTLTYARSGATETLTSDLTTSRIELSGRRGPGDPLQLVFAAGTLSVQPDDTGADLRLALPMADDAGAGLLLDARLAGTGAIAQRGLTGRVTMDMDDLEFIALLVDALTDITGRLTADATLAGTVSSPRVDGSASLEDGAASVDAAGIDLRDLQLTVTGNDRSTVRVTASARSGDGIIRAEATAGLGETNTVDAQISGERFTAYNTEDARVVVTPDLRFTLNGKAAELTGKLIIPSARITPQKRDSVDVVKVSDDEVIIGPRAQKPETEAFTLRSTVQVILGDDVRFEGFGLTTRIEGQLTARDRPGTRTTATGELQLIDGAYKAYGQNLDIRRGRLIFAGGAVTQPGLDIQASRYPSADIEVGVQVRGPLNQPEFSLYSEPEMTQQEQLSYLVLGRSLDPGEGGGGSGAEQAALTNAALALGLRGSGALADTLQDKIGLDELSIGAQAGEGNEQASLVLGKYLSPKLYVSYGVALFQPGQSFRLRYELSDKWVLKTQTGTQTGGDLIYTIERD